MWRQEASSAWEEREAEGGGGQGAGFLEHAIQNAGGKASGLWCVDLTIYQRPTLPQTCSQHSIGINSSTPHNDLLRWRCTFFLTYFTDKRYERSSKMNILKMVSKGHRVKYIYVILWPKCLFLILYFYILYLFLILYFLFFSWCDGNLVTAPRVKEISRS